MRLSILVVSRTAELLNRLNSALADASHLKANEVEILVSWNGHRSEEDQINQNNFYPLRIACRDPYHFAGNMNSLAEQAAGDALLVINDDVIPDPGSIDAGLKALNSIPNAGLIGGRLRSSDGMISHDGVGFTNDHSAYNLFENLIPTTSPELHDNPVLSPAIIGALMLIRRSDFMKIRFDETYQEHGEDTAFCFSLRQQTGLDVLVVPQCSGVHDPSTTRDQMNKAAGNPADMAALKQCRRDFLEQASAAELRKELWCATREAHVLRSLPKWNDDVKHWHDQTHRLQLHRLRLEHELRQLRSRDSEA